MTTSGEEGKHLSPTRDGRQKYKKVAKGKLVSIARLGYGSTKVAV